MQWLTKSIGFVLMMVGVLYFAHVSRHFNPFDMWQLFRCWNGLLLVFIGSQALFFPEATFLRTSRDSLLATWVLRVAFWLASIMLLGMVSALVKAIFVHPVPALSGFFGVTGTVGLIVVAGLLGWLLLRVFRYK